MIVAGYDYMDILLSTPPQTRVGIIGYGYIGKAIDRLFKFHSKSHIPFIVSVYDIAHNRYNPNVKVITDKYDDAVKENDIIIAATPLHSNTAIAETCFKHGVAYFDLTEDIATTNEIHEMCTHYDGTCMTQCGLAPGAVGVIAKQLMDQLREKHDVHTFCDVELRVGALPVSANNEIKYYLSWSPEGLINEYCNPCESIVNGSIKIVDPLEGAETIVIDGTEYEAFNTSGGLGSFLSMLKNQKYNVQNVNYKTIRYRGHREKLSFLLNELGLKNRQDLLIPVLHRTIPRIDNDIVVMFIQVVADVGDRLVSRQYSKRIYQDRNLGLSAIQLTTAAGVCAAVHWYTTVSERAKGVLRGEEIASGVHNNPYWQQVYGENV